MATDTDRERLLDAMLQRVAFDGWSEGALQASADEIGLDRAALRAVAPRGPVDMARAWHVRGDAAMLARLAAARPGALRFRDRIAQALRFRLEGADREVIRRSMALFALPQHIAEGNMLIWGTADAIWTALGDTSEDVNWYTKRLTLAGVIGATLLFRLDDTSEGATATHAFIDRRIGDVMKIETAKAKVRAIPVLGRLLASPLNPLNRVRKPPPLDGFPGKWRL